MNFNSSATEFTDFHPYRDDVLSYRSHGCTGRYEHLFHKVIILTGNYFRKLPGVAEETSGNFVWWTLDIFHISISSSTALFVKLATWVKLFTTASVIDYSSRKTYNLWAACLCKRLVFCLNTVIYHHHVDTQFVLRVGNSDMERKTLFFYLWKFGWVFPSAWRGWRSSALCARHCALPCRSGLSPSCLKFPKKEIRNQR